MRASGSTVSMRSNRLPYFDGVRRRFAAEVSRRGFASSTCCMLEETTATTTGGVVKGHIGVVQIEHPGGTQEDEEAGGYWRAGPGARLLAMYSGLLGVQHINIGYHKLVYEDGRIPELGFEHAQGNVTPEWRNPDRPQQMHLDIEVGDVAAATELALSSGAALLEERDSHTVLADAVGHPLCLYQGDSSEHGQGTIKRIVFDCFSPRGLAGFYERLLDMPDRVVDQTERVEIAGPGHRVNLAFQHSMTAPPRWPDPAYPAQLHLDLDFEDDEVLSVIESLGAIRRPVPNRPDHLVFCDPAGHPFCLGVDFDPESFGTGQVEYFARLADQ